MLFLPTICSVVHAEAEAIVAALKACPIGGSRVFEIRSDCKMLVDGFKEKDEINYDFYLLMEENGMFRKS
ncbi:hypothetical protein G4B88_017072 [Cannabis sativa]|uniref:RNase H type-1 domain-containing protein n=1 Tax=Cannabis sativa TaxID=3483 RepID=A0A7J6DTZ9_CANSA|nr:hypothetical protein G4B88_017072 [Cannabis sativa]